MGLLFSRENPRTDESNIWTLTAHSKNIKENMHIQANTKIKATSKAARRYTLNFFRFTIKIICCNGGDSF